MTDPVGVLEQQQVAEAEPAVAQPADMAAMVPAGNALKRPADAEVDGPDAKRPHMEQPAING